MAMQKVSCEIGGKTLTIETGRMAKQAHGSVLVTYGETAILAAAVAAPEIKPGQDFFPLTVDYRERTYAAGKIPGGFFKREGRPNEKEILTSRLIDRPIRSLFHKDYLNEVALTLVVVSSDCQNDTDIPAMIGASAALLISDIPFEAKLAAVRVGLVDGQFIANPTFDEMQASELDLVLAGVGDKVVMIEAGAKEVTEEKMMEAIKFGQGVMKEISKLLTELAKVAGKAKKPIVPAETCDEVSNKVKAAVKGEFEKVFDLKSKEARELGISNLFKEKVLAQFDQESEDFCKLSVKAAFEKEEKKYVREMILGQDRRPDGRKEREIRQITCETSILPRTHGSALFTRGQTQSLSIATLGSGDDQQRIDALEGEQSKSFMLHYNFPSFSVGETKASRGPGRREIGHGALAERALAPIIPDQETFPYTIRLVSDILESNGSSSMATVCGGTLSLMDAGVPIKAPVAGIALGLVTDETDRWKVLTDIAGIEDHLGDMDFKAAGTRKGLTALQMDLKIAGINDAILKEAFSQAYEARNKILDIIQQAMPEPRAELSEFAPRITTIKINPSKIGEIIGPGGKNIRKLVEETGAKIDIEDDGTVRVASSDAEASAEAVRRIQEMTQEAEIGKIYNATVKKLMAFGAFCEFMPGTDGLCHISEVTEGFAQKVNEYLKVGQEVSVKVVGVDERGKVSLSIKQAIPGGLQPLPADVERDQIDEPRERSGGGGGRSRSRR